MHVIALGLSHKVAPVEVRERLAFSPDTRERAYGRLKKAVSEGVILSTCNRTEIYAVVPDTHEGYRAMIQFLSDDRGIPADQFRPYLYFSSGPAAVTHLFRVSSGLDSMVLGEAQILGQVRDAFDNARSFDAAGPVLSALFRQAISAGKRARSETEIGRHAASVGYAAVELARKIFGGLEGSRVLLIGVGEMSELTAKDLMDNGCRHIVVASRTRERAQELAGKFGGLTGTMAELPKLLSEADIVISSTNAPRCVIRTDDVKRALEARRNRPLFLIDLAVPRDVEAEVGKMGNVFLYNIDGLKAVVEANLKDRVKEAERVEVIAAQEAEKFQEWFASLQVVPTIVALRDRAEAIRQAELAKMEPKLANLSPKQRDMVNAITKAIVNKMLHEPVTRLRVCAASVEGPKSTRVVRELFALEEE